MENDRLVQDAAWKAFQKLLPTGEDALLVNWADQRFKNQPAWRFVVLQALADKQEKAGKLNDLASTRETMGDELMKLNQPDKAAEYFDKALSYRLSSNDKSGVPRLRGSGKTPCWSPAGMPRPPTSPRR